VPDDRLTELYRKFGPVIYARCRQMLDTEQAAEDATQETFVRVHRHIDRAPDSREALAWIYRIATNYCLNEIRDRKKRPELRGELPELPDGLGEGQLADRDLARRLVKHTPTQLRTIAWLYHVDGLQQDEIANVLGISRRTVVSRLAQFVEHSRKFVRRSGA
jgi:RNA polymerase sigma-70 factor (ECF subfamily)